MTASYNTGTISATSGRAGGIIGDNYGYVINCYNFPVITILAELQAQMIQQFQTAITQERFQVMNRLAVLRELTSLLLKTLITLMALQQKLTLQQQAKHPLSLKAVRLLFFLKTEIIQKQPAMFGDRK